MTQNNDRTPLTFPPVDDLTDFQPRKPDIQQNTKAKDKKAIDKTTKFPSRERDEMVQINVRAPAHIADRFKSLCKDERWPSYKMLEILMDAYEAK